MPQQRLNRARKKRIADEVVVDCYTAEECAMGWYYYLEGRLSFPFTARCIASRSISPLKEGEKVRVIALARENDCLAEIFVLVPFSGRRVGAPLAQLKAVSADRATREAVEDWHYWLARGCAFGGARLDGFGGSAFERWARGALSLLNPFKARSRSASAAISAWAVPTSR